MCRYQKYACLCLMGIFFGAGATNFEFMPTVDSAFSRALRARDAFVQKTTLENLKAELDCHWPRVDRDLYLYRAVDAGNPDLVRLLCDYPVNPDKATCHGNSAFLCAMIQFGLWLGQLCCDHWESINSFDWRACARNSCHMEIIRTLVLNGASCDGSVECSGPMRAFWRNVRDEVWPFYVVESDRAERARAFADEAAEFLKVELDAVRFTSNSCGQSKNCLC